MANFRPARLAYSEFHPADGTNVLLSPIIFLHGVLSTKEVWDTIPQTICNRSKRKAFALDSRNHGDSEYNDEFSFDLNVVDLFHFMDTMKIQKAVLIGHSMGSQAAINAALLDEKARIEKIFAVDMFEDKIPDYILRSALEYAKMWSDAVESIPNHLNETEAIKFAKDIMYEKFFSKDEAYCCKKEDLYKEKVTLRRRSDGGYGVSFNKEVLYRAISNHETLLSKLSGRYYGPAYFIYGSSSQFNVPKGEANIRWHFPRGELIEYKNATHNIHIEFPEKFLEDILCRLNQKEN